MRPWVLVEIATAVQENIRKLPLQTVPMGGNDFQ